MLWSAQDLIHATGGTMLGAINATGISIDTRSLQPGDLFVALTDARDGHDFVAEALAKGAAGALVAKNAMHTDALKALHADAALLVVEDTLATLRDLAAFARARFKGKLFAITGSVGKTSTKEMMRTALESLGTVHAADASFNNHIGVPLTLARMPPNADYAVIEIGMNHPGEVAPLAQLARPDAAIITNIASTHIGHMGSLKAIAEEKSALFSGLVTGGAAILQENTAEYVVLEQAARASHARLFRVGGGAEAELVSAALGPDGSDLVAREGGQQISFWLGAPGRHMAENAILVLTAIAAIGADPVRAAMALAQFRPVKGRGARRNILGGKAILLDESYNASTISVRAALALLDLIPGRRRIAVLGDMREMGDLGPAEHASLAPDVRAHADLLFTCGPLMGHLHAAVPASVAVMHVEDAERLAPLVASAIRPGDVVLVKGSLGSRMKLVVEALEDQHAL